MELRHRQRLRLRGRHPVVGCRGAYLRAARRANRELLRCAQFAGRLHAKSGRGQGSNLPWYRQAFDLEKQRRLIRWVTLVILLLAPTLAHADLSPPECRVLKLFYRHLICENGMMNRREKALRTLPRELRTMAQTGLAMRGSQRGTQPANSGGATARSEEHTS